MQRRRPPSQPCHDVSVVELACLPLLPPLPRPLPSHPAVPPTQQVLRDMRQDWEAPTMAIEETWRFIPIAGWLPAWRRLRRRLQPGAAGQRLVCCGPRHDAELCSAAPANLPSPPPPPVVFGTTLPIGLLCALLFWRLGHYRWATLVAALLWLDVALLMLLGVGEPGLTHGRVLHSRAVQRSQRRLRPATLCRRPYSSNPDAAAVLLHSGLQDCSTVCTL